MSREDINELQRALGRVEGKLDMLLDNYGEDRKRLSAVEKKVWYAAGAATIIGWLGHQMFKV